MYVYELIKKLQTLNPDALVALSTDEVCTRDIEVVYYNDLPVEIVYISTQSNYDGMWKHAIAQGNTEEE